MKWRGGMSAWCGNVVVSRAMIMYISVPSRYEDVIVLLTIIKYTSFPVWGRDNLACNGQAHQHAFSGKPACWSAFLCSSVTCSRNVEASPFLSVAGADRGEEGNSRQMCDSDVV